MTPANSGLKHRQSRCSNRISQLTRWKQMETLFSSKILPHPPIPRKIVSGVENIRPLGILLDSVAKNAYQTKLVRKNEIGIQPTKSENYVPMNWAHKEKNTKFHTDQRKEERSFRVMLRNSRQSTDIEEILSQLDHCWIIRIKNKEAAGCGTQRSELPRKKRGKPAMLWMPSLRTLTTCSKTPDALSVRCNT